MTDAAENTYTPTYYKEEDGLPAPQGIYSTALQTQKQPQELREEAAKLWTFITTPNQDRAALAYTNTPTTYIIKEPGTAQVRIIWGIAPFLADPLANTPSPLQGSYLGIGYDIDDIGERPSPTTLPATIFTQMQVLAPTQSAFQEKLEGTTITSSNKEWFREKDVNNTVNITPAMPFPAHYAWDAFTEPVPAHTLWERIKCTNAGNTDDHTTALLQFLAAAHTKHNITTANKIEIDQEWFRGKPHRDAKQWAVARADALFPTTNIVAPAQTPPAQQALAGQPPGHTDIDTITAIIKASIAAARTDTTPTTTTPTTETESTCFKKYGMSQADVDRLLTMCGLGKGEEEQLPDWIEQIATKHMLQDSKNIVIRQLLTGALKFDEHEIPITPQLLKMIIAKAFAGDEDGTTAGGAMKGLTPYTMAPMTAKELETAHDYAAAVAASTATTVADHQNLKKRKATAPATYSTLLEILKTYTNLLGRLFTRLCPLYTCLISDVINHLMRLTNTAKAAITKPTLAAILWAVYKQTKHFVLGKMTPTDGLVPEWETLVLAIRSKQNITFLDIPPELNGTHPFPPPKPKRPRLEEEKKETDKGRPHPPAPHNKLRYTPLKMEVHPLIKEKLTAALPRTPFSLKKLAEACNIKHLTHIFPETRICIMGAITGRCPFETCRNEHDGSLVTKEMAERAVALFDPFINDPKILTPGK